MAWEHTRGPISLLQGFPVLTLKKLTPSLKTISHLFLFTDMENRLLSLSTQMAKVGLNSNPALQVSCRSSQAHVRTSVMHNHHPHGH